VKNAFGLSSDDLGCWVPLHDGGDGAQDGLSETRGAEEQARQKAPEPGQKQAAVVADGTEDGVDGVALWFVEVVSLEQAVGSHVA
jgi:hypothetical protein